jgi:hypothetical protein
VDESKLFGIRNAFKTFKEEFCDVTENIAIRRIKEWRKDDKSKKVTESGQLGLIKLFYE